MARPGFKDHRKFKRLVHLLQEPVPHVLGYMECLWDVAYQNGDPFIGDAIDVELAAQYPGEPGKLCKALLSCGLIDEVDGGKYQIHDLHENAPDYVKKRFMRDQTRRNKYTPRERKKPELGRPIQPQSELGRLNGHAGEPDTELGCTPSPAQPSPAQPSTGKAPTPPASGG